MTEFPEQTSREVTTGGAICRLIMESYCTLCSQRSSDSSASPRIGATLKANSSRWINERRLVNAKFSWQRGYSAFSVSESKAATVRNYIENQREHHQRQTFEEKYLEFLRRHRIKFDPRFVFEQKSIV